MEFKTKSVLRVLDYPTKDRPSQQLAQGSDWKYKLKSIHKLFLHSTAFLQPLSILPNCLQKSICSSYFPLVFHSFTFERMDDRNMIPFSQLLIGGLTSVNIAPQVFSSTHSEYSFNLYLNDKYTSTGRYKTTLYKQDSNSL